MAGRAPLPGYDAHTKRSQRLVVMGELRHHWDVARMVRNLLRVIEDRGGPGRVGMLPGEHYRFARLALRTCERARALAAQSEHLWLSEGPEHDPDHAERMAFSAAAREAAPLTKLPRWHQAAVAAVDALEGYPAFRRYALEPGPYDVAAQAAESRPE